MTDQKKTDIRNDEDIKLLVHTFYGKVQDDERLGYIFNDFAGVEWDHHLPRMVDFWSNLLFRTGRYDGKPFRQHLPLPIEREDFHRWYNLFVETVDCCFEGERAEYAKEIAGKIAASFTLRMEMEDKF
ncbi:MAG: group III truncated hemoglobin [Balneolaceae bacterium]|nr:group III truncated hemoglobin [Balneolaceae bacterium]